jgi:2-oxoglutarate ferredoxin oxidoreductase subunit gamma
MSKNVLFAGFGGQGIQFCSKVLAYAGMIADKEVSWLPSYGPEMRGGTSNCAVSIDDEPIASPLINEPSYLFVLNEPSYAKFINSVLPGGTVVYDSFLINAKTERKDINEFGIPATKIAMEHKLSGLANMIALGYLLKKSDIIELDIIKKALDKMVPPSKKDLIEKNIEALYLGFEYNENN